MRWYISLCLSRWCWLWYSISKLWPTHCRLIHLLSGHFVCRISLMLQLCCPLIWIYRLTLAFCTILMSVETHESVLLCASNFKKGFGKKNIINTNCKSVLFWCQFIWKKAKVIIEVHCSCGICIPSVVYCYIGCHLISEGNPVAEVVISSLPWFTQWDLLFWYDSVARVVYLYWNSLMTVSFYHPRDEMVVWGSF